MEVTGLGMQIYVSITREEGLRIPPETPCDAHRHCALALHEVCYGEVSSPPTRSTRESLCDWLTLGLRDHHKVVTWSHSPHPSA